MIYFTERSKFVTYVTKNEQTSIIFIMCRGGDVSVDRADCERATWILIRLEARALYPGLVKTSINISYEKLFNDSKANSSFILPLDGCQVYVR